MVVVSYCAGTYKLKVLFDPINQTYILLEKGNCYLMPAKLWQNFQDFITQRYTGNGCPLESWQTVLSPQSSTELVVIPTALDPEEFFSEFSSPDAGSGDIINTRNIAS